jgi:glycosyltransferase involved in cell wall biosynthesis
VNPGENGQLAGSADEFARTIVQWSHDPERLARTRLHARESAERFSWDAVWEEVYGRYEVCFPHAGDPGSGGMPQQVRMAVAI